MISFGSFTRRLTGPVLGLVLLLGAVTLLTGCRKHRSFRVVRRSDYVARRGHRDRAVVIVRKAPRRVVVVRGRVVRQRGGDRRKDGDDDKVVTRRTPSKDRTRRQ